MPEPAQVEIPQQAAKGMINGADESDAVEAGQPTGDGRFLLHPGGVHLTAHVQEMDGGPAPLLDEAPKCLHIIMMDAASADAQPLAFACLHQMESNMGVLKVLPGPHCVQVRLAKDKSIGAQRV